MGSETRCYQRGGRPPGDAGRTPRGGYACSASHIICSAVSISVVLQELFDDLPRMQPTVDVRGNDVLGPFQDTSAPQRRVLPTVPVDARLDRTGTDQLTVQLTGAAPGRLNV